jgi:hypothetical protein
MRTLLLIIVHVSLSTVAQTADAGRARTVSKPAPSRGFAVPRDPRRYRTGPLRRGVKPVLIARWSEIDRVFARGTRAERRALIERARREYGTMYRGQRRIPAASVDQVATAILRTPSVWASKYHRQLETYVDRPGSEPGTRETHIIQRHVNAPVLPALPDRYHVRVVDLGNDRRGRRQIAYLEQNDRRASRNHYVLITLQRTGRGVNVTAEASGIVRTYDSAVGRNLTRFWGRLTEGGVRGLKTGRSPAIEHLLDNVATASR